MTRPSESSDVAPSPQRGVTALLGLNVWLIACAIPAVFLGVRSVAAGLGAFVGAATLLVGVVLLGRRPRVAASLLLGAFPAAIVGTAAAVDRASDGRAYSAIGVAVGALALIAFGVVATLATEGEARSLVRSERALGPGAPIAEDTRLGVRRALLAVAAIGAFLVAIVAPVLGIDYATTWPTSPRESATFVAVVAGVVAVATVASIVGARLRATRTEPTVGRRIALAMAIGLGLGLEVFLMLR